MTSIHPTEVQRDEYGYWSHPGIPDFDEDHEAYRAWLEEQQLETKFKALEDEDETHPAYMRYFPDDCRDASGDVHDWNPSPPHGDEWFTLSIHDTEDGPYWVWARRSSDQQATAKEQNNE